MQAERFYTVERIERRVAVLVCGSDRVIVPLDQLPKSLEEGGILGVRIDADGSPDWRSTQLDPAEHELWKQEAGKLLAEAIAKETSGGERHS